MNTLIVKYGKRPKEVGDDLSESSPGYYSGMVSKK